MPAGRPPAFTTAKDMQKIIDKYFKSCEGTVLKDKDDEVIYNKYGQPVIIGQKPPTVTGLALALGFNSRQSLLNYAEKEEFVDTITRAKMEIEEYAESRLYDKDGVNGAKFNLINNFRGWRDKQEVDTTISGIMTNIDIDLNKLTPDQLEQLSNAPKGSLIETYNKMISSNGNK